MRNALYKACLILIPALPILAALLFKQGLVSLGSQFALMISFILYACFVLNAIATCIGIYEVGTSNLGGSDKVWWILILVTTAYIGNLLYFFIKRRQAIASRTIPPLFIP